MNRKLLQALLLVAVILIALFLQTGQNNTKDTPTFEPITSKEEVASYIHQHGELPPNFITKGEAERLGWVPREGNLQEVAPGMSIGGDRFYNREGLLPEKEGRRYFECDIAYEGGHRGPERLVYSNDGLIFYTGDHYASFEPLY